MTVLVTGAAGFIGFHVSKALLARGERVIGVDNLNDYYDVRLKEARLEQLAAGPGFAFARLDIAEEGAIAALAGREPAIDRVVHLAAQAGVRYSITNPGAYIRDQHPGPAHLARALPALGFRLDTSSTRAPLPYTAAIASCPSRSRTGWISRCRFMPRPSAPAS